MFSTKMKNVDESLCSFEGFYHEKKTTKQALLERRQKVVNVVPARAHNKVHKSTVVLLLKTTYDHSRISLSQLWSLFEASTRYCR